MTAGTCRKVQCTRVAEDKVVRVKNVQYTEAIPQGSRHRYGEVSQARLWLHGERISKEVKKEHI